MSERSKETGSKIEVFDMDGTLYGLVPADGKEGFEGSVLRQMVMNNSLEYIQRELECKDFETVLEDASKDEVGVSSYLHEFFGIPRKDYFNAVWDISPEGIISVECELIDFMLQKYSNDSGSKPVLLTAAPSIWKNNVLGYLGIDGLFDQEYTGEQFGSKQEVFESLAVRYDPGKIYSIGDQQWSDIDPAVKLGMNGLLVSGPSETLKVLGEL